jgi:hypothetical protein
MIVISLIGRKTQILALDGEGKAEHYDGDYTEYHDWKLGDLNAIRRGDQIIKTL